MDDGRVRTAPPSAPLLAAKLAPPPPLVNHIERPRVHRILDAGSRGPLTMLTAPAGSGKTVAMSSWTRSTDAASGATWFSIEKGDTGTRFWAYLQAGLCRALSGGYGIDGVPPAGSVRTELYLEMLADTLSRLPTSVIVILDDLQETDDAALAGLDFLLAHAPRGIRIVAATRLEPTRFLHRWRLAGALTEIRLSELAFTEAETGDLVRRRAVGPAPYQVGDLWRRTEGWPAGLRLAADARPGDPACNGADGSPDQGVTDYLVAEVLLAQPRHVQDVLLRASVPDRLCADLVDGLLDRTDGAQLIAELDRQALLLPTGAAPTAYRFHRTFHEVLRAELARRHPDALPPLHRRAAAWLAANGLPAEALRHALSGGDDRYAVEVLLDHWSELVAPQHDGGSSLQVPEPPAAALQTKPEVALAHAADRLLRRDVPAADDYLRTAVDHDGELPTGRREHLALVARGLRLLHAQLGGDRAEVLAAASELLEHARARTGALDRSWVDRAASVASTAIGSVRLDDGDLDAAERALCEALAAAERAGLACQWTTCAARLALVRAERGQLADASRMARASWDMRACAGQAPTVHRAPAYLALALVDLHRDRLAEADAHLDAAVAAGGSEPAMAVMIAAARVRVCRSSGDLDAGYAALLAGREALDGWPCPPGLARRLTVAEADLRTAHGEPGDVRRWLEPAAREADPRSAALSVTAARACLDDGDPRTAVELLPPWQSGPDVTTSLTIRLEAGLIAARAAGRLGDRRRASRALEAVLGMAEPGGHRRAFLDAGPDLRELLAEHLDSGTAYWAMVNALVMATVPTPPALDPRRPAPSEPLTERELTVLRYLQSILSNGEIATEMTVSVNTVKTHLRSIYRKLSTKRRRDTVRRARELHLL
jgi:LuxR family maltose regulon positive regulatory protein